jgi:hypothetical protein
MILCSDLHIRLSIPRARIDSFFETQERKIRFLFQQAQDSDGVLLIAGDFFHIAKPGEGLLRWMISLIKEYSITIILCPGQHDLPGHSLEQISNSGIGVLESAGVIHILTKAYGPMTFGDWAIWGCAYGEEPDKAMVDTTRKNLILWHKMIIQEIPLWPGQIAEKAPAILRKYPQFSVICTGDNHQSFYTMNGSKRFLVNPGSITRQTAAQVDHRPHIYKWENGVLTPIPIPIEDNVLDLSELSQEKERDSRIISFVERLNSQWESSLLFEKNLEEFFNKNNVDNAVKELIWGCLE